jgi:2-dehydropantoate 2-reductase
MRILVIGAGVIGSFNAARLMLAGHDVSLLARGRRYLEVQEHGIELEEAFSRERTVVRVPLAGPLGPDDAYDCIIVAVRHNQLAALLPLLAANRATPTVMVMGNTASGPDELAAIGQGTRVLRDRAPAGARRQLRGHHFGILAIRILTASPIPLVSGMGSGPCRATP